MEKGSKTERTFDILISEMRKMSDYRDTSKVDYSLEEILFLTVCAVMSGSQSYEEICDYGDMKLAWLRTYLAYEHGIPSHDTINRMISILNTKELEKMFVNWSTYALELPDGTVVHLDGKWLSRSATVKEQQTKKGLGGKQACIMVNVYCSALNRCLATTKVPSKAGEKQALTGILELLDLSNCLLTLDAGYCYEDVAEQIRQKEADYLIGLKKNQPTLYDLTEELFEHPSYIQTQDKQEDNGHGRVEVRHCKTIELEAIKEHLTEQQRAVLNRWTDLTTLIKIESQRTDTLKNKHSEENRYYITSKAMDANQANQTVRDHWQIENGLHWILDVVFGEDQSRKRRQRSAENFSFMRKFALSKLKAYKDGKTSMKRKMYKCAMSNQYLENILDFI